MPILLTKRLNGFTLAELLIALALLGVIATFTIPKVLQASAEGQYNAMAKEAIGAASAAFSSMRMQGQVSATTTTADLLPHLNHVSLKTTGNINSHPGNGTLDCSVVKCLKMHNGGVLALPVIDFGGTGSTNAIWFDFDPDGEESSIEALEVWIYYTGQTTTRAYTLDDTYSGGDGPWSACPTCEPDWFDWER